MNAKPLDGEKAGATPHSAQATGPSQQDVRRRPTLDVPCLFWFGPESQLLRTLLVPRTLRVGRDADNDVRLSGSAVSRHHAEITSFSGDFTLIDGGSRNGLITAGKREARVPLRPGTTLRLGDWVGIVTTSGDGAFREIAPGLWGSARLERALQPLRAASAGNLDVIVQGETGTGKELVARAVLTWSGAGGAFVPLNCAALSDSLLEAELFGHVRGAFTGAIGDRTGHIREADGGLLFLDEVAELPPAAQAKLLRVLQERELTPVGSSKRVPVSFRVVAATHRSLKDLVKSGAFRADLRARLDGLLVELPPLRERREDILPLFVDFARKRRRGAAPSLTPELALELLRYDWPGNVRELTHLAARCAVLCAHSQWGLNDVERLGESLPGLPSSAAVAPRARAGSPVVAGRDELTLALRASQGVVAQAARDLGVTKQKLYRLLQDYAIDVKTFRSER